MAAKHLDEIGPRVDAHRVRADEAEKEAAKKKARADAEAAAARAVLRSAKPVLDEYARELQAKGIQAEVIDQPTLLGFQITMNREEPNASAIRVVIALNGSYAMLRDEGGGGRSETTFGELTCDRIEDAVVKFIRGVFP